MFILLSFTIESLESVIIKPYSKSDIVLSSSLILDELFICTPYELFLIEVRSLLANSLLCVLDIDIPIQISSFSLSIFPITSTSLSLNFIFSESDMSIAFPTSLMVLFSITPLAVL